MHAMMIEMWKSDLFKMFFPENCLDTLFQLQLCPKICPYGAGYIVLEVEITVGFMLTGTPLGPAFNVATWWCGL